MSASRFYNSIENAHDLQESSLVGYFGYYLTEQAGEAKVTATTIGNCFKECDLKPPARISSWLSEGLKTRPPRYVKVDGGYRLHRAFKEEISGKLGPERVHQQTSVELRQLETKVSDGPAKEFLKETIDCFEAGANRAAIVMCWILVTDHLYELVFTRHLAEFNAKLALNNNNKVKVKVVRTRDDFSDIPDDPFIELLRSSGVINNDVRKILVEKLGIRNTSGHASTVAVRRNKADEFITDLTENVILKFPL